MPSKLKAFSIGGVRIEFPVVLASMAGYTDLAYRLICRLQGAPYCATEMMLDKCLLVGGKLRTRLVKLTDEDHPVAGQIVGNDPKTMAAAGVGLCEMGFDVIDLNFACPVRKALKRRRGGFLMAEPDLAVEIARAVVQAVDRPVGLKLRRKFNDADSDDAFWRIAEGAFDAGVSAVSVHARSVEAKYQGAADWAFLADVKRRFPDRTILGSGDVRTPQAALDALEQTRVDAVLVARGALGNPWFFRQVEDLAAGREPYTPDIAAQRDLLLAHFDSVCDLYGPVRGPKTMRKFGIKYARLHPRPREVRMGFIAVRSPGEWHAVVEKLYR